MIQMLVRLLCFILLLKIMLFLVPILPFSATLITTCSSQTTVLLSGSFTPTNTPNQTSVSPQTPCFFSCQTKESNDQLIVRNDTRAQL